jgi:iron complex outermembrane receptor protein
MHILILAEKNRESPAAVSQQLGVNSMSLRLHKNALLACNVAFGALIAVGASPASAQDANGVSNVAGSNKPASSGEIVVTAEKRSERELDVPVPITVVNTQNLANNGQGRIEDFFATVPGLSLAGSASGAGTQFVTIRGLATSDYQTPTVGTVIDDVPIGDSLSLNFGSTTYPDIDPSDLERIEVLKGPQGTLYGADSMGGVLKYVLKEPSTDKFSGNMQALVDSVDGGSLGYAVRGSVNVPVTDTFAIRASGFSRRDGGFIDDVLTGQKNINYDHSYGGHLAALWKPESNLSFKLGAIIQNTKGNGSSEINASPQMRPTAGDTDTTALGGDGTYFRKVRVFSGTIKTSLAGIDLTSVTGYSINSFTNHRDFSSVSGPLAETVYGIPGSFLDDSFEAKKFTQEVRAGVTLFDHLDVLVGGFYTHENTNGYINIRAVNAPDGSPPNDAAKGLFFHANDGPLRFQEESVFGNVDYHFSSRFDVQLGARQSWNKVAYDEIDTGNEITDFDGPGAVAPDVFATQRSTGHAFTYLVTPRFKITPDVMTYVRIATGYRIGGPNLPIVALGGFPTSYKPDKTTNYEIGLKASLFDKLLTVDASLYYIAWRNIQLSLLDLAVDANYTANAGRAKSEGAELQLELHPIHALTISAAGSLNNARLTQNLPATASSFGSAGERLPYAARETGSLSAEYEVFNNGNFSGTLGGTVSYIGNRKLELATCATCVRPSAPAYTTANLHFGVKHEDWLANLFVNNVGDSHGVTGGDQATNTGNALGYYASIIQPRTVGISLSRSF